MGLLDSYTRARGEYDPTRLTRTGPQSGASAAGLCDRPLYAYLDDGETPHYVLEASDTPVVATAGVAARCFDGEYAAFLAVTSTGVRGVFGGSDGDAVVTIPYVSVERVAASARESRGRFAVASARTAVVFETADVDVIRPVRRFVAANASELRGDGTGGRR